MLKVNHVTKKYGKVLANDDISLSIPEKSVALLVGPNGAGKSTLLKCIIGLLRYDGDITIHDYPNKSIEAKRILGYVPEIPHLYPLLTIYEHLEFIARVHKLDETWHERADYLLKTFELDDKKDKLGGALSKGMQQKLSICTALLPQPELLIFNEPLIGLDPYAIQQLKNIFRQLAETGHSLLISTHILDTVDELWDQVFILENGQLRAKAENAELKSLNKTLEQFFFDVTGRSQVLLNKEHQTDGAIIENRDNLENNDLMASDEKTKSDHFEES